MWRSTGRGVDRSREHSDALAGRAGGWRVYRDQPVASPAAGRPVSGRSSWRWRTGRSEELLERAREDRDPQTERHLQRGQPTGDPDHPVAQRHAVRPRSLGSGVTVPPGVSVGRTEALTSRWASAVNVAVNENPAGS
jgi:hypothetical protein